jgi:hypothetical protein
MDRPGCAVPDGWDEAPFTFVTQGVERAVTQAGALADDGIVGISGADVVQQCLNRGLIDEIAINLGAGAARQGHPGEGPLSESDRVL